MDEKQQRRMSVEILEDTERRALMFAPKLSDVDKVVLVLVNEIRAAWAESEALKEALRGILVEIDESTASTNDGLLHVVLSASDLAAARALVGSVPQPAED